MRISLRDGVLSIAALAGYQSLTGSDTFLSRHYLAPLAAGRYAAAAIAGHIALFLPGALVAATFPRFVSAIATGRGVRKILLETFGLVAGIGFAAFAVLGGMPGVVVGALFGHDYLSAASVVGTIALASVAFSMIILLTYFHLARRSMAALSSWAGVALVWVLVANMHGGMSAVADCILAASGLVLAAVLIPAVATIARPAASAPLLSGSVELPPLRSMSAWSFRSTTRAACWLRTWMPSSAFSGAKRLPSR